MEGIDSTANLAGLSILSIGVTPATNGSVTPVAPAQFAQQLKALTESIADPQALAVELQAAGLLNPQASAPSDEAGQAESTSALLDELAELIARLLKDAAGEDTESPTVEESSASPTPSTKPAEEAADSSGPVPEPKSCDDESGETTTPVVLTAALLQTITAFLSQQTPPPIPEQPHEPSPASVPPVGLVQTLVPPVATAAVEATPVVPDVESNTATEEDKPAPAATVQATPLPAPTNVVPPSAIVPPAPLPKPGNATAENSTVQIPAEIAPIATQNATTPATPAPVPISLPVATANSTLPTATPQAETPAPTAAAESHKPDAPRRTQDHAATESAGKDIAPALKEAGPRLKSPEPHQSAASESKSNISVPVVSGTTNTQPPSTPAVTEPHTLPPQDSVRLVERLGHYIVEARDQGRQMSVQITPPDLGPLRIEVHSQDAGLTARLTTESTVAQQLLQDHLPQLHETLQHLGANVERIEVVRAEPPARDRDVARSAGVGASTDWSASSGQSSPDRREEARRPNPNPRRAADRQTSVATTTPAGSLQELNIRI